ncbi:MAG: ATP synthase subunit b [Candidatus Daviesbacteria bacterium GW2011_GWA1_41_61]|uniref:ATP synthase subunit b n=1 Tax=Candidatus Daviesbacteria bacterium GW2011_GWA2_40_9 TaxID=1618424 RepID=A0A0G0X842_9BACT|nr:MAG: ATP synthase subunit b [Candidatus Daviesbacteria bacterium GW2011_GWC1_40_9]KKR83822.1 MAG: ATP synthase subunit b [Candidatus Daviesbacteria bacterium GW2011_GWA2_40_9]KKR93431.1 MAG: ATP synthase subunit b [Candidatus Daviesbacteria bacterium GW2011_GWB1_41_15]KKS15020.1 MAG: ATP synthase subunit b [Candidatus Daviesbacteria bacterium GW2011_GWA1_41_61]
MTLIMEILNEFGVKPVLLIAQVVNFLLLLFILKRFLYKPILKALEQRKQKIVQSLKNAEEIEKRLEAVSKEREEALRKASKEAETIIGEATTSADRIIAQAHEKAQKDISKMIERSQQSLKLEREKLYQDIKGELAGLVMVALEKVTGKVVTEKDQKELIKKSIKQLES